MGLEITCIKLVESFEAWTVSHEIRSMVRCVCEARGWAGQSTLCHVNTEGAGNFSMRVQNCHCNWFE